MFERNHRKGCLAHGRCPSGWVAEIGSKVKEIWEARAKLSALLSNAAIQDQDIFGLDGGWGSAALRATAQSRPPF